HMLPSVTMLRPASSWSRITVATASSYASSCCTSLNATRTSRPSSCCLNHWGRGYEPTIVVGRTVLTILLYMSPACCKRLKKRPMLMAAEHIRQVGSGALELFFVGTVIPFVY